MHNFLKSNKCAHFVFKAWCPLPEVPVNALDPECTDAHWTNSWCTFSCKPGFQGIANGVYEVKCRHSAVWDARASDCESKYTDRIQGFFSITIVYATQNATDQTLRKIILHEMCAINVLFNAHFCFELFPNSPIIKLRIRRLSIFLADQKTEMIANISLYGLVNISVRNVFCRCVRPSRAEPVENWSFTREVLCLSNVVLQRTRAPRLQSSGTRYWLFVGLRTIRYLITACSSVTRIMFYQTEAIRRCQTAHG